MIIGLVILLAILFGAVAVALVCFGRWRRAAYARTPDMWEAMQEATPPTWYHFTLPFVGVVGVLIGGCLRRRPPLAP